MTVSTATGLLSFLLRLDADDGATVKKIRITVRKLCVDGEVAFDRLPDMVQQFIMVRVFPEVFVVTMIYRVLL